MTAYGSHTQDNAASSVVTLTVPAGATHIYIATQTQDIRVTLEGTAPTATKGLLIPKDQAPVLLAVEGNERTGEVKLIETATTAVYDYQFWGVQI